MNTREEYYTEHQICPKCISDNIFQTFINIQPVNGVYDHHFKDRNLANCMSCGWDGVVHDLIQNKS